MNETLKQHYSKIISMFYGGGGVARLDLFMTAFESANKEEFDKAIALVLESKR